MDALWPVVLGSLAALVAGLVAFRWQASRATPQPPAEARELGYGEQRWERERRLWLGTLRRLEIQARSQSPPSERLLAEMEEARQHIAEAERMGAAR